METQPHRQVRSGNSPFPCLPALSACLRATCKLSVSSDDCQPGTEAPSSGKSGVSHQPEAFSFHFPHRCHAIISFPTCSPLLPPLLQSYTPQFPLCIKFHVVDTKEVFLEEWSHSPRRGTPEHSAAWGQGIEQCPGHIRGLPSTLLYSFLCTPWVLAEVRHSQNQQGPSLSTATVHN